MTKNDWRINIETLAASAAEKYGNEVGRIGVYALRRYQL